MTLDNQPIMDLREVDWENVMTEETELVSKECTQFDGVHDYVHLEDAPLIPSEDDE